MKKNILFVSHDASRTGAPIVFKNFITWVAKNTEFDYTILLKNTDSNRNALEIEFITIGPVIKWPSYRGKKTLIGKLGSKIRYKLLKDVPGGLKRQKFDLIYLNTVDSVDVLPIIRLYQQCPVILHVHEGEYSIKAHYSHALSAQYTQYINKYIVVSESTRDNLIQNFDIPAEKIELVNAFVPVKSLPLAAILTQTGIQLRSNSEFVAGGSGTADWRKGIDLFIQIATIIKRSGQKVKFVWVGSVEKHVQIQLDYELKRMGLTSADIIFTGSVPNPHDYFNAFDVFVLTSREDPFPLVCLEAASLGKPVICFADAGGMPEMVNKGGGIVVPYGDTQAMADAIVRLKNNSELLIHLGEEAKKIVQQYDIDLQAPRIVDIINQLTIEVKPHQ
ncbi:glycosyltransferase family 1 protein [Mucilaginibacter limnophilus]|uniref:Glycosyltransferase family 1 protein n=1 Tax=Mucilaginibacter limnophilus TaxID=1932778 RepID=A0A437MVD2_9SPHI|nr:glycosyltransferase family 4 protein [Mucilaginibacter limnophilus]RVU01632.1 glycosyltransferase family 1 protein [Mucilaginibacter limnophilus]